jgi:hypothetical protein
MFVELVCSLQNPKVRVVPNLKLDFGIPTVSSAFKAADAAATTPYVMFLNSDIVVLPNV